MTSPISLVPKPSAEEEVRASCVRLLRDALARAEAGQITTVVIIMHNVDGDWINKASETMHFSEAIGKLEITKAEWIKQYLEQQSINKD